MAPRWSVRNVVSKVWVGGCQNFCQHRREGASILLESFESAQRKSKRFEICPAFCECYRFRRPNIARQLLTMFTKAKPASFCCGPPPPILERCKTVTLRDAPPPLTIPLEDREDDIPFSAVSQIIACRGPKIAVRAPARLRHSLVK